MQNKTKAPVNRGAMSGGQKKTVALFITLPVESVKHACPRSARKILSRMIDRLAAAGWPWNVQISLWVNAILLHAEEADGLRGVAA